MPQDGLMQDLTPEQMDRTLAGLGLGPPAAPALVPALTPKPRPVPSIGRIVHYWAYGTPGGEFPAGVPRAAIITEVDLPGSGESPVGLAVLNPTGLFFNRHVPYSATPDGGCWGWPPFVPPAAGEKGPAPL